jgi:hypothetical protein
MIIIIFSSIFLVSFCNDLPNTLPEFKKEISVVGILDTSQQPQKIYAFYTAKLYEDAESIENALVEVFSEAQKLRFTLGADTIYALHPHPRFYFSDRPETLHVIPEKKYFLRLVTAEGDSVMGETVVPGRFRIITPAANSAITVAQSLVIEWTKSKSAYGYIINFGYAPYEYPPGSGNYSRSTPASYQTMDTTHALYSKRGFKKGKYIVKVMAYDQNYHYHHAEAISSCGVIGGYGVFGSGVIDSVAFTIE